MAERTTATGRRVAQRRWQAQRHIAVESVTERFGVQQELEAEAQAVAVRRAHVQAVEACSTGTLRAIQTGTACEDDGVEAERVLLGRFSKLSSITVHLVHVSENWIAHVFQELNALLYSLVIIIQQRIRRPV